MRFQRGFDRVGLHCLTWIMCVMYMAQCMGTRNGNAARNDAILANPSRPTMEPMIRGLHSSTSQLNVSVFYWIGGARERWVAHVQGVSKMSRVLRACFCVRHDSS